MFLHSCKISWSLGLTVHTVIWHSVIPAPSQTSKHPKHGDWELHSPHSSALSRSHLTVYWLFELASYRLALCLSCPVSLCVGKALFLCLVQCQAICYHLACLVYRLFLPAFVFWLCLCFLLGPSQYVIDTVVPNSCNFIKIFTQQFNLPCYQFDLLCYSINIYIYMVLMLRYKFFNFIH